MMPGRIVNVLVKKGEEVALHQGIVVVEAMKMENEITAHKSGTISKLPISAGSSVATGDTLAVIS